MRTLEGSDLQKVMLLLLQEARSTPNLFPSNGGETIHVLQVLQASFSNEYQTSERIFSIKICTLKKKPHQPPTFLLIFKEAIDENIISGLKFEIERKSRILASVTHELRAPLNGSLNFLQLALDDSRIPEDIKSNTLELSKRCNLLLLNLVNDILDLSRIKENKLSILIGKKDIFKTIQDSMQLVDFQARRKGLYLEMNKLTEISPTTCTDHSRLNQILLNLLTNAVKFTEKGGITIHVSQRNLPNQRLVDIAIQDTGIGITEADQKQLFQEYTQFGQEEQRVSLNPGGLGLGLSIANQIACALGPEGIGNQGISVESQVGKGSIFSFTIEDKNFAENKLVESRACRKRSSVLDVVPHSPSHRLLEKESVDETQIAPSRFVSMNIFGLKPPTPERKGFKKQESLEQSMISIGTEGKPLDTEQYSISSFNNEKLSPKSRPFLRAKSSFSGEKGLLLPLSLKSSCSCPRVLVIDDDAFNIIASERLFLSVGMKIDTADSGVKAIETVSERAGQRNSACGDCGKGYQIIFLDLTMPIMDGYETAKQLRSLMQRKGVPWCPIIACSAITEEPSVLEAITKAGMDDICPKPLTKEKLVRIFNNYHISYASKGNISESKSMDIEKEL